MTSHAYEGREKNLRLIFSTESLTFLANGFAFSSAFHVLMLTFSEIGTISENVSCETAFHVETPRSPLFATLDIFLS